mgnify:CR=1 FL=1
MTGEYARGYRNGFRDGRKDGEKIVKRAADNDFRLIYGALCCVLKDLGYEADELVEICIRTRTWFKDHNELTAEQMIRLAEEETGLDLIMEDE